MSTYVLMKRAYCFYYVVRTGVVVVVADQKDTNSNSRDQNPKHRSIGETVGSL
jgi:hypothetical protein